MQIMELILFVLALSDVGEVPPSYAATVYLAAQAEGVPPEALGGVLIAENTSREYRPVKVSRHDSVAARGLFQLAPGCWPRYCQIHPDDLFDPFENIKCAAKVVAYLQDRHGERWRRAYRCSPNYRNTDSCKRSADRVRKQERLIRKRLAHD